MGPITTEFDETRWDLIPPMRPRFWGGSRDNRGPGPAPDPPPGGAGAPVIARVVFGGLCTREPPEDLGRIGGIRSHLVSSESVVIGPIFDPFVIGCKFLNFSSFGPFLASDGLGTRGKRFLGPVSPPVHLTRGRGTQIGPCLSHFWVLWTRVAFDLLLRVGV